MMIIALSTAAYVAIGLSFLVALLMNVPKEDIDAVECKKTCYAMAVALWPIFVCGLLISKVVK